MIKEASKVIYEVEFSADEMEIIKKAAKILGDTFDELYKKYQLDFFLKDKENFDETLDSVYWDTTMDVLKYFSKVKTSIVEEG